jgi:hypothetical protein
MSLTRRDVGIGAAAMVLLGAASLGYRHFFGRWYAPTPYDDLLHQIVDRKPAARLGAEAVKKMPGFNVASLASRLRQPGYDLSRRARSDAAANRLTEVSGWIVPESVALYSALASQFT